jgi:uracil phosphoribosyltransferase
MIHNLSQQNCLLNQFLCELRDESIQQDRMRFRKNLERMGNIFAYEISRHLEYEQMDTTTPLGVAQSRVLKEQPVIATILRAGLPMHQGMLDFFDHAESGFVSAYRKFYKNGTFEIQVEYMSIPELDNRVLILTDPMLATGQSMLLTYKSLLGRGKPKHTHIVAILASLEGVEFLQRNLREDEFTLWVAAIDDELTAQAYIVPGLGDAGDLAYGGK